MRPSFDLWIDNDRDWKEARQTLKELGYKEGFIPIGDAPVWIAVYGKTGVRESEMIFDCYRTSKGYGKDGNSKWQIEDLRDLRGLA